MHPETDHLNHHLQDCWLSSTLNFVGPSQIKKQFCYYVNLWPYEKLLKPRHWRRFMETLFRLPKSYTTSACTFVLVIEYSLLWLMNTTTPVADIWQRWLCYCRFHVCIWGTQDAAVTTSMKWTVCRFPSLFSFTHLVVEESVNAEWHQSQIC